MAKEVISSHIFVFPFRWDVVKDKDCLDTCIDKRLNVETFIECLNAEGNWNEDESVLECIKNEKEKWKYNTYSYFYSNVRKAIYGKKNLGREMSKSIVRCFNYKNVGESSTYEINILGIDKPYELMIDSIKLKVYDTGVATLSYFLENKKYRDKEDILRINDYGRRVYPQYLPLDSVRNNFLAKELKLELKSGEIKEEFLYEEDREKDGEKKDRLSKDKPTRISKTIMNILGEKFISTEIDLKEDSIFIRPIIDDRMFVICYFNDNTCSTILTKFNRDEYLKSDFWYQFLFVDNGGATCKDEEMKKVLLSKSTYTRWKNYGSLFGISRYSFVLLCDKSWFSKNILYNHMNTIYYEMILLALVQRASVLRFSDETSRISCSDFENRKTYKKIYEKIKKLQQYYIRFVNTIYFREVTAQEQGIELYDKLMELMRVEREVKRLDEEINEIQRYVTLETNEETNRLVNLVTNLGVVVALAGVVATIFTGCSNIDEIEKLIVYISLASFLGVRSIICLKKIYIDK